MKISVICVTENRQAFIPWLFWNYDRLKWPNKELVIIDSSETAVNRPKAPKLENVIYERAKGLNVPAKRNVGLALASGDYITWLDDDDWRHPDALKTLGAMVNKKDTHLAGGKTAVFCDLASGQVRRFTQRKGVLFANMLISATMARGIPFLEDLERGSDLAWLELLQTKHKISETYEIPSLFLCHDQNLGNKAAVHYFNRPLSDFTERISKSAWADTDSSMEALRIRIKETAVKGKKGK